MNRKTTETGEGDAGDNHEKGYVTVLVDKELYRTCKARGANMSEIFDVALSAFLNIESTDLIAISERKTRLENTYAAVQKTIQAREEKEQAEVREKEDGKRQLLRDVFTAIAKRDPNLTAAKEITADLRMKKRMRSAVDNYLKAGGGVSSHYFESYDNVVTTLANKISIPYDDVNNVLRQLYAEKWTFEGETPEEPPEVKLPADGEDEKKTKAKEKAKTKKAPAKKKAAEKAG